MSNPEKISEKNQGFNTLFLEYIHYNIGTKIYLNTHSNKIFFSCLRTHKRIGFNVNNIDLIKTHVSVKYTLSFFPICAYAQQYFHLPHTIHNTIDL